ncbi:hypothetical protein Dimus_038377 [Dionaea muscipula]
MVITGNSDSEIARLKKFLSCTFKIKDLGPLRFFLGIEVARSSAGIMINQRKYVLDILNEVGLSGAMPAHLPIKSDSNMSVVTSDYLKEPKQYRRLVGKLIYLTITRPEITYTVNTLRQHMHQPQKHHLSAALHLVDISKNLLVKDYYFLLRINLS